MKTISVNIEASELHCKDNKQCEFLLYSMGAVKCRAFNYVKLKKDGYGMYLRAEECLSAQKEE